jgi:hypothetical protein
LRKQAACSNFNSRIVATPRRLEDNCNWTVKWNMVVP